MMKHLPSLTIAACLSFVVPATAQDIIRLSPEQADQSPYWQTTQDGNLLHIPSGVLCPLNTPEAGLTLKEINIYRPNGRDVACQYQIPGKIILSVFITDYEGDSFEAVAQISDASVTRAKKLTRFEPGSMQCDGMVEQILQREPRATKEPTPAHCALYGDNNVHSALILAPAGKWIIKLRHTRSGAPQVDRMTQLIISTIDMMRELRRGVFKGT